MSMRERPEFVVLLPLLALVAGCGLPQEGPDSSDLWRVDLVSVAGLSGFGEPTNLTDRPGYDDQPAFLPGGESLLYVSRRRSDVDVLRLDLGKLERTVRTVLTGATSDRIYSPQPLPEGDGFSAVLVGPGGLQRLVRFGPAGGMPEPFADVAGEKVAYYRWIDARTLAVVVRATPPELALVHLDERRVEPIARAVGRSVQLVPGRRAVSYVSQESPTEWWIVSYDLDSRETTTLARTLQGQVDHAWLPDGALLMAQDARIYRLKPGVGAEWELVADFTSRGLGRIGRIAVDPSGAGLVFVADRHA